MNATQALNDARHALMLARRGDPKAVERLALAVEQLAEVVRHLDQQVRTIQSR
jgi:hypothetical protein